MSTLATEAEEAVRLEANQERNPNEWIGIHVHRIPVEYPQDTEARKRSFVNEVEASEVERKDAEKIFGNKDGLSFLDKLAKEVNETKAKISFLETTKIPQLQAEVAHHEEKISFLETEIQLLRPFRDQLLLLRFNLLSGFTVRLEGSTLFDRTADDSHMLVHGGHILADSEAIIWAWETFDDRAQLWTMGEAFVKMYRISHEMSKGFLRRAPGEIIECFNMSANVRHVELWKEKVEDTVRNEIDDGCEEVVGPWKAWVLRDSGNGPCPGVNHMRYDQVKGHYDRHSPVSGVSDAQTSLQLS